MRLLALLSHCFISVLSRGALRSAYIPDRLNLPFPSLCELLESYLYMPVDVQKSGNSPKEGCQLDDSECQSSFGDLQGARRFPQNQ